ncbi:hypothetical protein BKA56DRAFT_725299, partial [Ilyonectria sp. MPI-CAGE-AT-0026]
MIVSRLRTRAFERKPTSLLLPTMHSITLEMQPILLLLMSRDLPGSFVTFCYFMATGELKMSSAEANGEYGTDVDDDLETPSDHGEVEANVAESDGDGNSCSAFENTEELIHNGREFYK